MSWLKTNRSPEKIYGLHPENPIIIPSNVYDVEAFQIGAVTYLTGSKKLKWKYFGEARHKSRKGITDEIKIEVFGLSGAREKNRIISVYFKLPEDFEKKTKDNRDFDDDLFSLMPSLNNNVSSWEGHSN